jgi:hypothetical protein
MHQRQCQPGRWDFDYSFPSGCEAVKSCFVQHEGGINPMRKVPLLVRLICYFFIFMGVASVGTLAFAWLRTNEASNLSVSFLTNSFVFKAHPLLFTITCLFFVGSGITGLTIVMKRSFAYDLGIAYCITVLVFFSTLIILKLGLISGQITSLVIQAAIHGGFLAYLTRHRTEWKKATI